MQIPEPRLTDWPELGTLKYAIRPDKLAKTMQGLTGGVNASSQVPVDSKDRALAPRTDIVYRDNAGYNLTVDNLPWGKRAFNLKRYRLGKTQNLELVEERSGRGGTLKLSQPLPTDSLELIVLECK